MKYDLYEKMIQKAFNAVETPAYDIQGNIDRQMQTQPARRPARKLSVVICAAVLMLSVGTVFAASNSAFRDLLMKINPSLASFFEPVELSCTDQGIKMEVVAVWHHENMVKAYVTFEDLESNRIDRELNFIDYYSIKGANSMGWRLVDFDEGKGIATILVDAASDKPFDSEAITFKISNIFYNQNEIEAYDFNMNWADINREPDYVLSGEEGFLNWFYEFEEREQVALLKPEGAPKDIPGVESARISNIGIIDGQLHVQYWQDPDKMGHSAGIYILDYNNNYVDYSASFAFDLNGQGMPDRDAARYPTYNEQVYDIDLDQLDNYRLLGHFSSADQLEGDWQVTFQAQNTAPQLDLDCNIALDYGQVQELTLNPFGILIRGTVKADFESNEDLDILLYAENGTYQLDHHDSRFLTETGNFYSFYRSENPIEIDQIQEISINGTIIKAR